MTSSDPCEMELRLARSRFAAVAVGWELDDAEAAALVGSRAGAVADGRLRETLGVDGETRMRLVVEVARALNALFDRGHLIDWLRDGGTEGVSPLDFMSRGAAELRAMRRAADGRRP